jgi:hypothetical protein
MDPLTASIAAKSTVSETALKEVSKQASRQLSAGDVRNLAQVKVVETKFLDINAIVENTPIREGTSKFFSAPEYSQIESLHLPDLEALQLRIGSQEFTIPLHAGGVMDALGVKNAIQFALSPALELTMRIRLEELTGSDVAIATKLERHKISLPTPLAVAVRAQDAGNFFMELEKQSDQLSQLGTPRWFEAKRIDYLVGEQYLPGKLCNLPIVGGASNWAFKSRLDLAMEGSDWGKLGSDVVMIVSIAAVPFATATGWLAMSGWVAANATFGAVTQGCISYLSNQDQSQALADAGKGALLGAAGGLGGVLAVAKVAPAISNPLLSATASGASVGSITGGTEATIRVIETGADLPTAAAEIATGALVGAGLGAGLGAAGHGVSHVVSKLSIKTPPPVDIASRSQRFEKLQKEIEPRLPTDRNVHMGDVHVYSKSLNGNLDDFAAHLKTTNPTFAKHVETLSTRLKDATSNNDVAQIAAVQKQIRTQLSGELAEALGVQKFRPLFDKITTQARVQDGATIIDLVCEGAKRPMAIGGHRYVEKGANLAVEIKAGTENYFRSEIASGHLLKQVGGHADFGPGLVVTTRDVTNKLLVEGGARETLRQARSAIYRLLPLKADIDAVASRLVMGT